MAPNRKKKKATVNTSRGFATVSQPSKPKEAAINISENEGEIVKKTGIKSASADRPLDENDSKALLDVKDMTPEQLEAHLEDADLQHIVDSFSARCNQDAYRQATRLEQERRHLRSQAFRLSTAALFPEQLVDDLLTKQPGSSLRSASGKLEVFANDTDLLVRVWTLSKTLTTLKLPKRDDAIEHVLTNAAFRGSMHTGDYVWGLQQALEWYASACQQEDLPDYEYGAVSNPDATSIDTHEFQHPGTTASDTQIKPEVDADQSQVNRLSDEEDIEENLTPISNSNSEDEDPASFNDRYVRLQTLLFHTDQRLSQKAKKSVALVDRKSKLENRIRRLERDVLFERDLAEGAWKQTLREMQINAAKTRQTRQTKQTPEPKPKHVQQDSDLAGEDEDMLGAMFSTNEEDPSGSVTESDGKSVQLIDFGNWTGTQPRRLLEEVCRSIDPGYKLKFGNIATGSYSSRQKVDLQWLSERSIEEHARLALPEELTCTVTGQTIMVCMEAIAAATAAQAECYLSTITLFLLVQSKHCDLKQSNRLPTIWRDVFADLSQSRKFLIVASEKGELKHLREIISQSEKTFSARSSPLALRNGQTSVVVHTSGRQRRDPASFSEDEARARWKSRESSLAYQTISQLRQQLPVYQYKDEILEAIDRNPLTIICADTGAGKSTQVPTFVLEYQLSSGHDCRIMVTQPRRISAISLARRVSQELGENGKDLGTEKSLVGYAIRLESKTSRTTRITFATTGVLLRMIESSPNLDDLNYLVLDEVHERTLDLDLLFIALKQLQQRRPGLKLILMSATVDAQKFSGYFGGAPILNVPGRTFPVEIQYLEDAIENTLDINCSGRRADTHSDDEESLDTVETGTTRSDQLEAYSSRTRTKLAQMDEYRIDYQLTASLIEAIATKEKYRKYSSAILVFMPGIAEIRRLHGELLSRNLFSHNWIIHLLHSTFSTEDLEQAFSVPPVGNRKIVIATNIAETGITIPDVTAVVDTCKEKVMRFDERRQLSRLTEGFISRSSARQRKGRAARVQEGLCFHLVTRYRYEHLMLEQHVPEILRLSLQDPILRIKVWNLGSAEETLASAIDPPTPRNVRRAIEKLKDAGALSTTEELTSLGKRIAHLPLEVVLGKLAIFGIVFQCLDAVLTIIAALSSKPPFQADKSSRAVDPRIAFARSDSDLISTLNAYQGWIKAKEAGLRHQFCQRNHLSDANLSAIEEQKVQLLVYLVDAKLIQLEAQERALLSKSRSSSKRTETYRMPERFNRHEHDEVINAVVAMAFYPKVLLREGKGWRNVYTNQQMSLVSNSVNRGSEKAPKWLCFYEAMQAKSGTLNVVETSKIAEIALVTALGVADFRFFSGVMALDNGRIRFGVRQWKELAAIKALRTSLSGALERCWQTSDLALSALDQQWIETFAWIVSGRDVKLTPSAS